MENLKFFSYIDYRTLLKALVTERKKADSRQNFQSFAHGLRLEPNTLSKMLNGYMHFSKDQLFLATAHLGLFGDREEFIELLFELQSSSLKSRKNALLEKIETIRARHRQTSSHITASQVKPSSDEDLSRYYLDPWMQIVHIGLSIPHYQSRIRDFAKETGLPLPRLNSILSSLSELGLAVQRGESWIHVDRPLHLPREAKEYLPWRHALCGMGLQRTFLLSADQSYGFTVLFSADEATRKSIQEDFLEFLSRTEKKVRSAANEGVYQMNFDLLPWAGGI